MKGKEIKKEKPSKEEYISKWYEAVSELNFLNWFTDRDDEARLDLIQADLKNIINRCAERRQKESFKEFTKSIKFTDKETAENASEILDGYGINNNVREDIIYLDSIDKNRAIDVLIRDGLRGLDKQKESEGSDSQ